MYASEATIQQFLQLDYAQFIAVRDFLYPDAQFSTEHGVKGEEYDNVVFVISKGWNQYQFETSAPMITGHATIPKGKKHRMNETGIFSMFVAQDPEAAVLFLLLCQWMPHSKLF